MHVVLGDKKLHIMQHDELLLQSKYKDSAAIKYNSFVLGWTGLNPDICLHRLKRTYSFLSNIKPD